MTEQFSLLFIGCGNMGGAMLQGWLASGLEADRFTIIDPMLDSAPDGVRLHRSLSEVYGKSFDAILLGFKPQQLVALAPEIATHAHRNTQILSILAGVELAVLRQYFPDSDAQVRIMPNLAASLGKSPVALASDTLDEKDKASVSALMNRLGTAEWIDESQFDLVTALAGSGPGFVYRFIDALIQGAVTLGLPPEQAERLAVAMVDGASELAAYSSDSPAELARRVASPGGVTQVGLDILDEGNALQSLLTATLRGASERSAQMAAEARKKS
ncbi:MAG: pyrroline-5-carboxylate reductase [Sphingomonadaceae bacterium]